MMTALFICFLTILSIFFVAMAWGATEPPRPVRRRPPASTNPQFRKLVLLRAKP